MKYRFSHQPLPLPSAWFEARMGGKSRIPSVACTWPGTQRWLRSPSIWLPSLGKALLAKNRRKLPPCCTRYFANAESNYAACLQTANDIPCGSCSTAISLLSGNDVGGISTFAPSSSALFTEALTSSTEMNNCTKFSACGGAGQIPPWIPAEDPVLI